ncbi:SPASM domain-containing protein [Sporosalibacterium faouarense]|uniref:SPASM domain-containing protein n=1 Tax=Sporosalibacterium faouarense TaxID=516123 RepID=UPI00192C94B8|nr:SPASM domain-containing protein [Sporosalibacterium faouarense]
MNVVRGVSTVLYKVKILQIGNGNVLYPEGAAIENLLDYLPQKQYFSTGKCGDVPYTDPLDKIKSLSIDPNGDVIICRDFSIGNIIKIDIIEIIDNYDPYENEQMKVILEEGVQGLLIQMKNKGIRLDSEEFFSICDMCATLREKSRQYEGL